MGSSRGSTLSPFASAGRLYGTDKVKLKMYFCYTERRNLKSKERVKKSAVNVLGRGS
jgi:hypothetical protein